MTLEQIKELCRYERLMLVSNNTDSVLGKEQISKSVDRIINYVGKRSLSVLLKCERDEVCFLLNRLILSI